MSFEQSNYNNNYSNYNKDYCPTVYGAVFSNKNSEIDKTSLSFSMWQKTIKITIAPLIETIDGDVKVDYKGSIGAFLSPTKAYIFSNILKSFKEDPKKYNNYGVASGQALITICTPDMFGKTSEGPIINIKKITSEGGVEQSYSYEIKTDYNAVHGFNEKSGQFNQDFESYKTTELDLMIIQLDEYVKAMTNAYAFANTVATFPYFDKLALKLGVDLIPKSKSFSTATSYFNSNNQNNMTTNGGGTTGTIPHASLANMIGDHSN